MHIFKPKLVGEGQEREKIKITVFIPTRCVIENSKKIAKKFQILKNTILTSFLAKIGGNRSRKRENKDYRSNLYQPDAL